MVGETIEATLMAPEAGELRGCVFGPFDMGEGVMSVADEESARESMGSIAGVPLLDCVELSISCQSSSPSASEFLLTLTRGILRRIVGGIAMIVRLVENACKTGGKSLGDL